MPVTASAQYSGAIAHYAAQPTHSTQDFLHQRRRQVHTALDPVQSMYSLELENIRRRSNVRYPLFLRRRRARQPVLFGLVFSRNRRP
jgi:hypothetical protein